MFIVNITYIIYCNNANVFYSVIAFIINKAVSIVGALVINIYIKKTIYCTSPLLFFSFQYIIPKRSNSLIQALQQTYDLLSNNYSMVKAFVYFLHLCWSMLLTA